MAPPSSQDEALSRYSASGEVPRSELEVERALGTLDATHKVARNPGLPREDKITNNFRRPQFYYILRQTHEKDF